MHKLRDAGAAIPADVDNAEITLKGALAQRDASREQLDELKNGARREDVAQARARASEQAASEKLLTAGSRIEDIRVAVAQVKVAQGRVDQIQNMIDELTIRAPRRTARRGRRASRPSTCARATSSRRTHGRDADRGRSALRAHLRARDRSSATSTSATSADHGRLVSEAIVPGRGRAHQRGRRVLAAQSADRRRARRSGVRHAHRDRRPATTSARRHGGVHQVPRE